MRSHNRAVSVLAATLAAMTLGAAPALAGENDDGDGDSGSLPAQTTPAPSSSSSGGGSVTAVPEGGVATGAGGMATQGTTGLLGALASGALVLMAGGGGALAVSRRRGS